ncbi:MAG: AsmA-like C-terminal region-containing protein, partial [Gemmataceae bacterium]
MIRGEVFASNVKTTIENVPTQGEARLALTQPYAYTATATATPSATTFQAIVPEIKLPFEIVGELQTQGKLTGTIQPFVLNAVGTARATNLTIGGATGQKLDFHWDITPERAILKDVVAEAFRGTIRGQSRLEFVRTRPGSFQFELADLDSAALARMLGKFPITLAGKVGGKLDGKLPAVKAEEKLRVEMVLDVLAPTIQLQGLPTEKLTGQLQIRDEQFRYQLEGRTLGGKIELKGQYPGAERGSLRLQRIDLHRYALEARRPNYLPLYGMLDVALDFRGDFTEGSGRVDLRGLRWGEFPLASDIAGALRMRDGTLELNDLSGRVAGGQLRGNARVGLKNPQRNSVNITLDRASAKQLLAPVPSLTDSVDGELSVTMKGRIGPETRLDGEATMPRGRLFGVLVSDVRVPMELVVNGPQRELTIRDINAHLGTGRLTGQARYSLADQGRLQGELRFTDAQISSLWPDAGGIRAIGSGRVSGRFEFSGNAIQSMDDLEGNLNATLVETSVREVPILRLFTPYLAPIGINSPFRDGEVQARLAKGSFRVHRLALSNPAVQLFAEGTVGLNGRLDLDIVAQTGSAGPQAPGLARLLLRVPALGPIPLGVVRDVSQFLSSRVVRLHATGTVGAPQVQINRASLLTEEAVRFFLGRTLFRR